MTVKWPHSLDPCYLSIYTVLGSGVGLSALKLKTLGESVLVVFLIDSSRTGRGDFKANSCQKIKRLTLLIQAQLHIESQMEIV